MKISLNQLRFYENLYKWSDDTLGVGVEKLVEQIGAQLGAVEEIVETGSKYEGAIIVKVVSTAKHPNADKLSVCRIDDGKAVKDIDRGDDGLVQVVCGAPNVHEGLLAVWLPPGMTVPSTTGKEPFVLEARDFRGETSNGMLASPKELGLGDSHEGLLELDDGKPGDDFAKTYQLDDTIIDIENKMFTHRPDCFGLMGVAREIAGIQGKSFKGPDWYASEPQLPKAEGGTLNVTIVNELPELVPRFTAVAMSEVEVKPSPIWLQIFLTKMGQKPINNVVDLTNYYMLLTGQPLHAYDYDKVKALSDGDGAKIVVRNPKPGEKIKLLNGKEIEPRAEAIMIATDRQLIGVGGAMGGTETEVDENTKNIILECASFDMYSIRRTSMAHGLFTDAVTRFTKGQSPLQCLAVSAKAVEDIQKFAGGKVAGMVIDDNHLDKIVMGRDSLYEPVSVTTEFVNIRLGLQLSADEMKKLLENVEFQVDVNGDELTVTAPFWRTDVELREDVVEEIGRLYGYDNMPTDLPKRDLSPAPRNRMLDLHTAIRNSLAKAGANEALTYSFVHGDLLGKVSQDTGQAFQVSNALSPDLQYYRLSLTPSLLDKIHPNIKAGYDDFAIFEIGKGHIINETDEDGLPLEFDRLSLVVAGKKRPAGAAYYEARKYLTALLASLNLAQDISFKPLDENDKDAASGYYQPGRSAAVYIGDTLIGRMGEYKTSVRRALKLPAACAGFELGLKPLLDKQQVKAYVPLPRFPKVTQDITLDVPAAVSYQEIFEFMWQALGKVQPENSLPTLGPLDIFQKQGDTGHKHVTFRFTVASYERTLTAPEVNEMLDKAAAAAQEKFGAKRV